MLRTNSKRFKENLNNFVLDAMKETLEYEGAKKNIENAYRYLYNDFKRVYGWQFNKQYCYRFGLFCEYMAGLPHEFTYYYDRAIEQLGNLLEKVEDERNKFSESDAEKKLSYFIYREMMKYVF